MPVARLIGLDAGTMRLTLDALAPGYDPACDTSGFAEERVALLRCFLYGTCIYHLVPCVTRLLLDREDRDGDAAERGTIFLLSNGSWRLGEAGVERRVRELREEHANEFSCQVVAEAETARLAVVLTCDPCLATDLEAHTNVKLLRPVDFWTKLKLPSGSPALWFPVNHLAAKTWWRH